MYCPHIPQKIKSRWIGPFHITKEVSPIAFRLDLPLGWRIHLVFHVSKLKRYMRSEEVFWKIKPPPPLLSGDTVEYEVERILQHQGKGAGHWYLVVMNRTCSDTTITRHEHTFHFDARLMCTTALRTISSHNFTSVSETTFTKLCVQHHRAV